jgi:hypothetical protein
MTRATHEAVVMKIFLAGATGAIGKRLVPLLLKAGHRVSRRRCGAGTPGSGTWRCAMVRAQS